MIVLIRPLVPLLLTLACGSLVSCASEDGDGGGTASASCAAVIVFRGHSYVGAGEVRRDPATTGRLAEGVPPACNDGSREPGEAEQPAVVEELVDVPLDTAFLSQDTVFVREGRELPAATRVWYTVRRCTSRGTFELTSDWLGVTGPRKVRFDGDLRPPYRLRVHVAKGPRRYVGATIALHADRDTDPALGPADVKASLWRGGQVVAEVSCERGRFQAHSLRAV